MRNMYLFLFALLAAGPIQGCSPTSNDHRVEPLPELPVLTILLLDITGSDDYLNVRTEDLQEIVRLDQAVGSMLVGMHIQANSTLQEPVVSGLMHYAPPQPTQGRNFLDRRRLQQEDERRQAAFQQQVITETARFEPLLTRPKTEDVTDVNGALQLALDAATPYARKGYRIRLIVVSDLKHTNGKKGKTLQPVRFPPDTEIVLIGKAPEVPVASVFPDQEVLQFSSFTLFLNFIKN